MRLIARPSVSPRDAGCQELLIERLEPLGFRIWRLRFGEVDNLWAEHGSGAPLVAFAGHTDVVPPGPLAAWRSDPFTPMVHDGRLYGRGAADMKSSLAAFITAIEEFLALHPEHPGTIALLITSDEEGVARDGTAKVVEWLSGQEKRIDHCIVGEPSSLRTLGDVIKTGRRGSLNGRLSVRGIQGHIAYPDRTRNPIHMVAAVIQELVATEWDQGHEQFAPTSFQISNIHSGTGADNVVPGELELEFNLRYSPAVTDKELEQRIEAILQRHGLDYTLAWRLSGRPFLTRAGALIDAIRQALRSELAVAPQLSTGGGTSDGRFIAATGAEVVELGPFNGTIHQVDEYVPIDQPQRLARVYRHALELLLPEP